MSLPWCWMAMKPVGWRPKPSYSLNLLLAMRSFQDWSSMRASAILAPLRKFWTRPRRTTMRAVLNSPTGLRGLPSAGGGELVEGAGGVHVGGGDAVAGVVEDLVLRAGLPGGFVQLGDVEADARVAVGGGLPFELELEIGVLVGGDDVGRRAGDGLDAAVFDGPAGGGELFLLVAAPALGGFAVEEELPARGGFGGGELGEGGGGGDEGGDDGDYSFHGRFLG